MAPFLVTAFVASGLMVPSPLAQVPLADDFAPPAMVIKVSRACDRAVSKALQMTGGELLSVQPVKSGKPICRVTVLVANSSGRPKKIILRIPMDF